MISNGSTQGKELASEKDGAVGLECIDASAGVKAAAPCRAAALWSDGMKPYQAACRRLIKA